MLARFVGIPLVVLRAMDVIRLEIIFVRIVRGHPNDRSGRKEASKVP